MLILDYIVLDWWSALECHRDSPEGSDAAVVDP
jgi:hypothetical protein